MLDQNKYKVSSKIESVYYGYDDIRLLYGYPASNVSIYHKWTATNDTWPYFDSGKMDYYDIRWRCNKIIHYSGAQKRPLCKKMRRGKIPFHKKNYYFGI